MLKFPFLLQLRYGLCAFFQPFCRAENPSPVSETFCICVYISNFHFKRMSLRTLKSQPGFWKWIKASVFDLVGFSSWKLESHNSFRNCTLSFRISESMSALRKSWLALFRHMNWWFEESANVWAEKKNHILTLVGSSCFVGYYRQNAKQFAHFFFVIHKIHCLQNVCVTLDEFVHERIQKYHCQA